MSVFFSLSPPSLTLLSARSLRDLRPRLQANLVARVKQVHDEGEALRELCCDILTQKQKVPRISGRTEEEDERCVLQDFDVWSHGLGGLD
ncbi:unnamed protein product [Urochloa humidicola]